MKPLFLAFLLLFSIATMAQQAANTYNGNRRFEQLGTELPTPNSYRTASGSPGKEYWQQRADYTIKVELDDVNQKIIGTETITYTNKSPDELRYLWLQLDQNLFKKNSMNALSKTGGVQDQMSGDAIRGLNAPNSVRGNITGDKEYGYNIMAVKDKTGKDLRYTINNTMMRVDLPMPLASGQSMSFQVDWNYFITEYYGRSGYEFFSKDGNYNYFIAHWFPRMAVYDDVNGWQHKQFLGQGEFTLPFGDYKVEVTLPSDMVVASTGECQNYNQVLSSTQLKRLESAKDSKNPVLIVTQEEAEKTLTEKKNTGKKTWSYKASNVRDFAFAASRRFIWDAMLTDVYNNGKRIWSMSYYPKEGNPLWSKYSTRAVEHTLRSYGKRTIEYPYPVAISCHSTAFGGMEYPMISFNGGRPEADGTYSESVKAGMIGVIIHEVGHNFFPMIINSDERQWSWQDEGLNTFCQYLAEQEWDRNFPSRRGEPQQIVAYMKTDKTQQVPIMTNSENIMAFGPNAYAKPATALNILRETVMGRELFDYAFKEYARRWAFKSPTPADFFRTMEDASGVDLDWFWRGWFYGTDACDISMEEVDWYNIDSQNPDKQKALAKADVEAKRQTLSQIRNKTDIQETVVEKDASMRDFYNSYDPYTATEADKKKYDVYVSSLSAEDKKLMEAGSNFYAIKLKNVGGLVMPIIIKMEFEDGTSEVLRIPAEIWRLNDKEITKTISTTQKVAKFTLDPFFETADIDLENNSFPREPSQPSRFQLFKQKANPVKNPMQIQRESQGGAVSSETRN